MKQLGGLSLILLLLPGQRRDAVFLKGMGDRGGGGGGEGGRRGGRNGEAGGVVHHGDGPRPDGRYRYHY